MQVRVVASDARREQAFDQVAPLVPGASVGNDDPEVNTLPVRESRAGALRVARWLRLAR